ncbi:MAG TPA: hypothetical protein DEP66_01335 [Acidimicrobiaceae bacterium]|nr:hypothetical protein [Acidimicrobiaceae bacterium]HCB36882.1 hypothetical protein [Acidimicrobiaceae bacterium]
MERPTRRLLSAADAQSRLAAKRPAGLGYLAMFSSYLGGVVTDPALMTVPIDDHMVHRGHAVFDTATLTDGRIYRLGAHTRRLLTSARLARIDHPWSRDDVVEMVVDTAAAAGVRDGAIRYWLSVGPGGFSFSPQECPEPCFYCVIFEPRPFLADVAAVLGDVQEVGVAEATVVDTPMKPRLLARVKSNNYLLNVLTHLEAADRGGTFGILVDGDGSLAESCVLSACVVTPERVLETPPFDVILAGTTVERVLALGRSRLVPEGLLTDAVQRTIDAAHARSGGIVEMFLCGGDTHVIPVTSWDGVPVGDGAPGPVTRRVKSLLDEEARTGSDDPADLIEVPYG